ncbi:hypothetical protein [Ideonella livida]|uniref:Uncharacterized protein n=1 Tax=Ideonella livida TaxID=2707176 RepID=A0A7C9PGU5_9BURK|nr:hypothetical protein [Ideonella livida]NDY91010.1 hypothetical protein [Ideonella livida]
MEKRPRPWAQLSAGRSPRGAAWRFAAIVGGLVATSVISVACGGGGSADANPDSPPDQDMLDDGQSTGPVLATANGEFLFRPDSKMTEAATLDRVAGGTALALAWNPSEAKTALRPGMKVLFFGRATQCDNSRQGPLDSFDDARLLDVAQRTGMAAQAVPATLRWTPVGTVDRCTGEAPWLGGDAAAFLSPDDEHGGVALLTTTGAREDGSKPFFDTFTADGQDGAGTNNYLQVGIVSFRMNPSATTALKPWAGGKPARVQSTQTLGTATVEGGNGQLVQAKQQIGLSFLNRQCFAERRSSPCQLQYILTTAIVRRGVQDWSEVGWFRRANVLFDPVQGGIAVMDGRIGTSGTDTVDAEHRLPLWSSQGSATQHGTFSARTFDVTISFEQFQNALKIIAARKHGVPLASVDAARMVEFWGGGWNDTSQWVLLSTDVGQEVYNPDTAFRAELGGGFRHLYVGQQ